ncbi:MAG TPA: HipA N-terminal domain-containing protein [Arsenicitalea sp.]|jgi:hypothetical protein|nr:HipA N-terminal domain-containing protein [Arsenicitalea sp.]
MPRREVHVLLGNTGRRVGTLRSHKSDLRTTSFTYSESWRNDGFPIAPAMPLVRHELLPSEAGAVLPDAIADSCPDGWGLRW